MKKVLLFLTIILLSLSLQGQIIRANPFHSIKVTSPYGPEKISNGAFDSTTGYTTDGGWTISGGTANFDDATAGYVQQSGANMVSNVEVLKTYLVTFDLTSTGTAQLRFTNFVTNIIYKDYEYYSNGANSFEMTLPADIGTGGIGIRATTASNGSFTLDNLSIKEVL